MYNFYNSPSTILKITGIDTEKFLQGQLTNDINNLAVNQSCFAFRLNNKGKIECFYHVLKQADCVLLRLSTDIVASEMQQLNKYKLRAKINIEQLKAQVVGISNLENFQKPSSGILLNIKNALFELWIFDEKEFLSNLCNYNYWNVELIKNALLDIFRDNQNKYLAHQLNMEHLAISFKKGCYVGQEIVARTEYKGKVKRRMFSVRTKGNPQNNIFIDDLDDVCNVINFAFCDKNNEYYVQLLANIQTKSIFVKDSNKLLVEILC